MSKKTAIQARALIKQWRSEYPAFKTARPLRCGIHADLYTNASPAPASDSESRQLARAVQIALAIWTRKLDYIAAVAKGGPRVDLTGTPVAQVTDAEQARARTHLSQRPGRASSYKKTGCTSRAVGRGHSPARGRAAMCESVGVTTKNRKVIILVRQKRKIHIPSETAAY